MSLANGMMSVVAFECRQEVMARPNELTFSRSSVGASRKDEQHGDKGSDLVEHLDVEV